MLLRFYFAMVNSKNELGASSPHRFLVISLREIPLILRYSFRCGKDYPIFTLSKRSLLKLNYL